MAKHTDCFLYIRVKGKTLDNLYDLLKPLEINCNDKSALSLVLEKAVDYWVYDAVKGQLAQKYGDIVAEHRDPEWKSLKEKQISAREEKEALKKAMREGNYE